MRRAGLPATPCGSTAARSSNAGEVEDGHGGHRRGWRADRPRPARQPMGGRWRGGAHAMDQCGTRHGLSALRPGMAAEPHGDGGDFRHLSHRRRRHADRLGRHLRPYRPPRRNPDGAGRLTGRHVAVRHRTERAVAVRGTRPDGRRRRPDSGTIDRSGRGVRVGRRLEAGRLDHHRGAGRRLRGGAATGRRADPIRPMADAPEFLGARGPAVAAAGSRMVPAAP
jgi:hypothetical protein